MHSKIIAYPGLGDYEDLFKHLNRLKKHLRDIRVNSNQETPVTFYIEKAPAFFRL